MWYYEQDGQQKGPVDESTLRGLIEQRNIHANSLIWKEGMGDWATVSATLPDALTTANDAGPAPVEPEVIRGPYAPPGAGSFPNASGETGLPPPAAGTAKASMITGIVALVMAFCCSFVGLPIGIVAVVLGNKASKQLQDPADRQYLSQAKTGIICGWIAIPLAIVMSILGVAMQLLNKQSF